MKTGDRPKNRDAEAVVADSVATAALRYPDFIVIGAQKAGTTWLDRNLRRHPGLWLPPVKEMQYFNDLHVPSSRKWTARYRKEKGGGVFTRYVKHKPPSEWDYRFLGRVADIVTGPISDEWYGRIFALAGSDQLCGEITPDYCTLPPEGIEHILRLTPKVKIVLSMRDPIDRCWSHMRMLSRNRGIAELEDLERLARSNDILQRADYPAMISKWKKYIPADRFLVVFMDDIEKVPQDVLEKICAFLNAEYSSKFFKKSDSPIHVGEAQTMPSNVEGVLKERLRPIYDGIAQLYPEIGATWLNRHY